MITPKEGLRIVEWVSSSCGKLEESIYSCDITNGTCEGCFNGACKNIYIYSSIIKKEEKLSSGWEKEVPNEYRFTVKNSRKISN